MFTLKRHLVRSPVGIRLQEQFALFRANFVRWAATWVKDVLHQVNHTFTAAIGQVKPLVRTIMPESAGYTMLSATPWSSMKAALMPELLFAYPAW